MPYVLAMSAGPSHWAPRPRLCGSPRLRRLRQISVVVMAYQNAIPPAYGLLGRAGSQESRGLTTALGYPDRMR